MTTCTTQFPKRVGKWTTRLLEYLTLALLATLPGGCRDAQQEVVHPVNFKRVNWYLQRAATAYESVQTIQRAYPNTVHIGIPDETDVLYFVEHFPDREFQVITVRGTDNLKNALQDLDYLRSEDSALGIPVHRGFDADAQAVLADLRPYLRKSYTTYLTGHSLGAAISTLLMMYLQNEGYRVAESVNFGQPKLTNEIGVEAFDSLPLLRVIDGNDVVPTLPTSTLLDSIGGFYKHLGQEVTLLDGPYYAYLDQKQALFSITWGLLEGTGRRKPEGARGESLRAWRAGQADWEYPSAL